MTTDAHVHFFSRRFFALLGASEIEGWRMPPEDPVALAAEWVAEFDRHGVSRAVLIASHPGDLASVFAARAAYPERLWAAGMVNPAIEGIAEKAAELDLICLFPAMHQFSLEDARVRELIAAARRPVFVHCGKLSVGVRAKLGLPAVFDSPEAHPDRVRALADRFPETVFILPHFGSGLFEEALAVARDCPRVHFDTSSTNSWIASAGLSLARVFERSLEVVGPQRLLFGTDSSFFPRGWHRAVYEQQVAALEELGCPAEDQALILGGNLTRIFNENNRARGALNE